jgi:hypothetical protein
MAVRGNFYGRSMRQSQGDSPISPVRGGGAVNQQVMSLARNLANNIIRQRELANRRARLGRIYTSFDPVDDILPNNQETVTRGLFSGNTGTLTGYFTSSTLTNAQQSYFTDVYDKNPLTDSTAVEQFSIAYGHFNGSGSKDTTGNLNNDTPSRAIYKQYAQLLLPPNDKKFTFDGTDSNSIYVINFNRARYREKIDPGNMEINLKRAAVVRLIDDSSVSGTVGEAGLIYNIVSGSIDAGTQIYNSSAPVHYGLLYPQHGIVLLNGDKLDEAPLSIATELATATQGHNHMKLYNAMSSSYSEDTTLGLQARSSEAVKSTYYFVRMKNAEYNYSNNPSFITGSLGQLAYNTFVYDPQVYITTAGLYNERKELLAVAKLSQPLLKSFTREVLIKVKLDF